MVPDKILIHYLNKEIDATEMTALEAVLKSDDLKVRLEKEADELSELLCSDDGDLDSINERLSVV